MVGQAARITVRGLGFKAQNALFTFVVGFRVYVNVSSIYIYIYYILYSHRVVFWGSS